jgi:hypothetical protein
MDVMDRELRQLDDKLLKREEALTTEIIEERKNKEGREV